MKETQQDYHEALKISTSPSPHHLPKTLLICFSALLIIIIVSGIGYYLGTLSTKNTNQISEVSTKETNKEEAKISAETCPYNGLLPKETYLEKYTVQQGDTLLSIAKKQLDNTARVEEVVFLNYQQYPSLHEDYTPIRAGWELFLPPKFLTKTTGNLVGYAGKLVKEKYNLALAISANDYSEGQHVAYNASKDTLFSGAFLKNEPIPNEGDCVLLIVDTRNGIPLVLATTPQDRIDYFKDPKAPFAKSDYSSSSRVTAACLYESIEKYGYSKYIVQPGDSLNSIAQKQLGDSSKVVMIKAINDDRYRNLSKEKSEPQLYKSANFIEVGWELILPPINPDTTVLNQMKACFGIDNLGNQI